MSEGRRLKLGILANEFFDLSLGRMGGFGWAAREVSRIFEDPALGVDVVFLTGELRGSPGVSTLTVHGRRLLLRHPRAIVDARRARSEGVDLLLVMDYRPNYRRICWALPRTPMLVWIRDPRPPDDVAWVSTLRVPGADGVRPQGIFQPDCRSLGTLVRAGRLTGRPVLFASPSPHLREKLERMIGMTVTEFAFLPNPVAPVRDGVRKASRPRVIFLARHDPYKRPWLYVELATRFPDVVFLLAGRAYHTGEGTWQPDRLPPNVQRLGHVDGLDKSAALCSAWVLVNTSIHEGLAVSFLESLACETPLLACVDPGGLVSRFGVFAGRYDGTGLAALPSLTAGLERLLADSALRGQLGREGRAWVEGAHSPAAFLAAFRVLCERAGVRG